METSSLEKFNYRADTGAPRMSFAEFRALLARFSSSSLVRACVEVAWRSWQGGFESWFLNEYGLGVAPLIAPLARVYANGEAEVQSGDIGDLIFCYSGITQSEPEKKAFSEGIARAALGANAAFLVPSLETAKRAGRLFAYSRIMASTWLPSRVRIDEFMRTLWLAKRMDERLTNLGRVSMVLGMEMDVFIRACLVLFAVAMKTSPTGRIPIDAVGDRLLEQHGIDRGVLELCAWRLSMADAEIDDALERAEGMAPPGMLQFNPSVLVSNPLFRTSDPREYICPSPVHMMAVVRERVRDAISSEPGQTNQAITWYGEFLEQYVEYVAANMGHRVLRVDEFDPGQERHADLLLVEGEAALVVEVKRSMGVSFASRGLTRPVDVIAVLDHFLGAYRQCLSTYSRKRWERESLRPTTFAAIVLIDESMAAEGAVFGDLYARQTAVSLPFEVMGITEFEDAIGVLGVRRLVAMIQSKHASGHHGALLAQYAMAHLRLPTREVAGARDYLRSVAEQLGELGRLDELFNAKWP